MYDVRKMVKYSAEMLYDFENGITTERNADNLVPSLLNVPKDTERLLDMEMLCPFGNVQLHVRFDEVVLKGDTAYCIVSRRQRSDSNYEHHCKGCIQTALLGYLLDGSEVQLLDTSDRLVEAGYDSNHIDLSAYMKVAVLKYEDAAYDCLVDQTTIDWLADKIDSLATRRLATLFDREHSNGYICSKLDVVELL